MDDESLASGINPVDRYALEQSDPFLFEQRSDAKAQVAALGELIVGTTAQDSFQRVSTDAPEHLGAGQSNQILQGIEGGVAATHDQYSAALIALTCTAGYIGNAIGNMRARFQLAQCGNA
ncbi:hypothetical protein AN454_27780 [Pseudomonas aeruginosa]|nr:hypothetical protein AN454_27780 [Pseudomonas aeruginosa]